MAQAQGLVLVPSVFGWPDVFTVTDRPWAPSVYYPARGLADWEEHHRDRAADPLVALVGSSLARVLRALTGPMTTLELAARLGVAPSAASRRLTALATAGLVERVRIGKRVLYSPGRTLTALTALLEPPARGR